MADINQVNGAYGGVTYQPNNQAEYTGKGITGEYEQVEAKAGSNLPVKTGFWSSFKAICFKEIKVELTPYQQKIENEINEFLHQEITWEKVHDFLFQEVSFGKKRKV